MRCHEVVRELAVPTGNLDASGLAEHLERCPRCASWAEGVARFDRLWDATRPPPPAPETWETTWAGVSGALDRAPVLEFASGGPGDSRPWRRPALVAFGLAQAAALLIVVGLGPRPGEPRASAEVVKVDIPEGQDVLLRSDHQGIEMVEVPPDEDSGGVASSFDMLNDFEAMAFNDSMAPGDLKAMPQ